MRAYESNCWRFRLLAVWIWTSNLIWFESDNENQIPIKGPCQNPIKINQFLIFFDQFLIFFDQFLIFFDHFRSKCWLRDWKENLHFMNMNIKMSIKWSKKTNSIKNLVKFDVFDQFQSFLELFNWIQTSWLNLGPN